MFDIDRLNSPFAFCNLLPSHVLLLFLSHVYHLFLVGPALDYPPCVSLPSSMNTMVSAALTFQVFFHHGHVIFFYVEEFMIFVSISQ